MQVQAQVQELREQELPLVAGRQLQWEVLDLAQARGQVQALEARVRALAGLLAQVQAEVQGLARAVARVQVRAKAQGE